MNNTLKACAVFIAALGATVVVFYTGCSQSAKNEGAPELTPPFNLENACNNTTGYFQALEVCRPDKPCTRLSQELVDEGLTELTSPSHKPTCKTSEMGRDVFDDGEPYTATGIDNVERYACIFKPTTTNAPLVVWLHPGGSGNADDIYNYTNIRKKAVDYSLSSVSGFAVISVQGRALHYPTSWDRDGNHHDFYFRDLNSPSLNPDIAFVDHLIDSVVAQGGIDTDRIYIMGWSNGAMFSQMYSIARFDTATPGGNKVAAAAVFSGGDPFHQINKDDNCQLSPYPTSTVPLFIVRRSCDAALACDSQQKQWFDTPQGHETQGWAFSTAPNQVGTTPQVLTIDGRGREVAGCATTLNQCADFYGQLAACMGLTTEQCGRLGGFLNHLRWPDGVGDGGLSNYGVDYEDDMLEFLKNNSR